MEGNVYHESIQYESSVSYIKKLRQIWAAISVWKIWLSMNQENYYHLSLESLSNFFLKCSIENDMYNQIKPPISFTWEYNSGKYKQCCIHDWFWDHVCSVAVSVAVLAQRPQWYLPFHEWSWDIWPGRQCWTRDLGTMSRLSPFISSRGRDVDLGWIKVCALERWALCIPCLSQHAVCLLQWRKIMENVRYLSLKSSL